MAAPPIVSNRKVMEAPSLITFKLKGLGVSNSDATVMLKIPEISFSREKNAGEAKEEVHDMVEAVLEHVRKWIVATYGQPDTPSEILSWKFKVSGEFVPE